MTKTRARIKKERAKATQGSFGRERYSLKFNLLAGGWRNWCISCQIWHQEMDISSLKTEGDLQDQWSNWQAMPRAVPIFEILTFLTGGTITWTQKLRKMPSLRKRRHVSLKLIKSSAISGRTLRNSCQEGEIQIWNCRSDNCIKNYYYSTLRKHIRRINKNLKASKIGKSNWVNCI